MGDTAFIRAARAKSAILPSEPIDTSAERVTRLIIGIRGLAFAGTRQALRAVLDERDALQAQVTALEAEVAKLQQSVVTWAKAADNTEDVLTAEVTALREENARLKNVDSPLSGIARITTERAHQLTQWTRSHDMECHDDGSLQDAATTILGSIDVGPDWARSLRRKYDGDRVKRLTIAGALIAAELDRMHEV